SPVKPHGESSGDAGSHRPRDVCRRQDVSRTGDDRTLYLGDRICLSNAAAFNRGGQLSTTRRSLEGHRLAVEKRKTALRGRNPAALVVGRDRDTTRVSAAIG